MAKPKSAKGGSASGGKTIKKIKKARKVVKKTFRRTQGKKPARRRKVLVRKSKIKNKKIVKKTIAKPAKEKQQDFSAQSLFKARIKVIGVGGGGGSIVSEIGRSLQKATFVVADTDIRALKRKPGIRYFWFGEELTRGLGTGVNIDLAKQAADSVKEKIGEIFKDQDIIIFIASLGGGLGSGATQVFAEEAKKYGAITFGIFTLPFKFEGKNKARIAQNALKSLRQSLNVSLTIPNEKIFKIIDDSTPITSAFSVVNKSLINSLESLIDLIYSPGIINIDFADLRTILKGRGNLAFLNTIEESGKNRAEKICEKTFVNPLLQNSAFTAEKILFNIMGSENLSMFEVEKVSSHIAKLNPEAKIIFGISKNSKLKNKIKTTILMTGEGSKEKPEVKKVEFVKKESPKKIEDKKPDEGTPKKPLKKIDLDKKKKEKTKKPEPAVPAPAPTPVFPSSVPVMQAEKQQISAVKISQIQKKELLKPKKNTIRRSGLEIKKAEEQEEKERIAQEKEWEIPAFLRKVKFNK